MRKLFVSDLDGTLMRIGDNPSAGISYENMRAIQDFVKQGNVFAVATARNHTYYNELMEELGFNCDYIGSNEAQVISTDQQATYKGMPMQYYRKIDAYMVEHGIDGIVSAICDNVVYISCNDAYPLTSDNEVAKNRRVLKCGVNTRECAYSDEEITYKIMILLEPHSVERVKKELQQIFPTLTMASSDYDNIDITAEGGSKGAGVEVLQKKYGISKENTYVIGDSENDLVMFDYGISFAMEQGDERCKARATYSVSSVAEAQVNIMK